MTGDPPGEAVRPASPRREELLEKAYRYVLDNGLATVSLRPLAAAIGTSPRVLLFLFGSKDDLVRALLARARADELAFIGDFLSAGHIATRTGAGSHVQTGNLAVLVRATWRWLSAEPYRPLLKLWAESYSRSLTDPDGPWSGFAGQTVADWLALLASAQPAGVREDPSAVAERTLALSVLRGAFLDLLATGDAPRLTAAVERLIEVLDPGQHSP